MNVTVYVKVSCERFGDGVDRQLEVDGLHGLSDDSINGMALQFKSVVESAYRDFLGKFKDKLDKKETEITVPAGQEIPF